jgi:serine protease AprX
MTDAERGQQPPSRLRIRHRAAALLAALVAALTILGPGAAVAGATTTASVDTDPGSLWTVTDQIGAQGLWAQGITGEGITVAVIDTGIAPVDALSDPGKVVAAVDLSLEASTGAAHLDTYGHGTHMAGIIAGQSSGADPTLAAQHPEWFLGVAPDAAIVSVKVAGTTGAVDVSQVIAGIDWVVAHAGELDIRVLNLSFGTDSTQPYEIDPLAAAVERAWDAGIVVVAAAGNEGRGIMDLARPADDPYVIAVAAAETNSDGTLDVPSWATSGDGVRDPDLAAPGAHIRSLRAPGSTADTEYPEARIGDDRFLGSGSSQAAAVVSGAAALLLDAHPDLTPDQVKALLRETAEPFQNGQVRFQGQGFLDIAATVGAAVPSSAAQTWTKSDGSGSLEASRGSTHVSINGRVLRGETTWSGARWSGATWSGATWSGATWSGATWSGATWSGATWSGATWSGATWSGATWSGATWSGATWSGDGWR